MKIKMHEYIDQLLVNGKYEEAIPLIEEVWREDAQEEKKAIEALNRRLEALEKCKESNSYNFW
jgi:hypothetical protein